VRRINSGKRSETLHQRVINSSYAK